jgi:aryl-alcohol dehydrogenase-like predicted oxidoreductase
MKTVELGNSGESVSQLALGCMQMGTVQDEASSFAILDRYLERGGTFLDTANCYMWWHRKGSQGGESEELLGRWLARGRRRDEVVIDTKGSGMVTDLDNVWGDGDRPDWDKAWERFEGAGADTLRRAIDGSLRRLGTDYVDLYYVHVDDLNTPLEETLEALAGIVEAGKARYLGWSNVSTARLQEIRELCDQHGWPAPVAVQQRHSYLRPLPGRERTDTVDAEQRVHLAGRDDLTLVAYSPILQGLYDVPAKRIGPGLISIYEGPDTAARLAAVDAVADELGTTRSQVVLAWLMAQERPRVIPLVGPRTVEQYEELVASLDVSLDGEVVARLDAAGA